MRVLHVLPNVTPAYGGPTYSLVGYARAALAMGMEVTVAAPRFEAGDGDFLAERLPGASLRLFPGYGRGAFIGAPGLWSWLRRSSARFDLVHVHGLLNPVSSLSGAIGLRRGTPLVVRPFGMLSRYTFGHRRGILKRAFFRALDRPNLARVGGVHFTSEQERAEAEWHGLGFGSRGHVVPPPWIGTAGAAPASRRDGAGTRVVFLGRLNPVKNLGSLIAAWPGVTREMPGATLRIVGEGDAGYARSLRSEVTARGLDDSVGFDGFAGDAEKRAIFGEADLLVLPSHHENFGVVVLEALAHGIPVVVTPEVQLSSFVRSHALGAVVPGDPAGLSAGIVALLRDRELRERCRESAPELVAQTFSLESVGRKLRGMYESAIATSAA